MNLMRIMSDEQFAAWRNAWLALGAIGGAIALLAAMQAWQWVVLPATFDVQAPQIIEQGPMRTVLRVTTRRGDVEVLCTVTIDHARRSFVIAC